MWYWSMTTTLWGLLLTDSCWAWPFKEEMDRDYDKGRPVDYPEIRKPAAVGVIAIESRIYVASSIKSGDYINHHGHEIVQAAAPRNIWHGLVNTFFVPPGSYRNGLWLRNKLLLITRLRYRANENGKRWTVKWGSYHWQASREKEMVWLIFGGCTCKPAFKLNSEWQMALSSKKSSVRHDFTIRSILGRTIYALW